MNRGLGVTLELTEPDQEKFDAMVREGAEVLRPDLPGLTTRQLMTRASGMLMTAAVCQMIDALRDVASRQPEGAGPV